MKIAYLNLVHRNPRLLLRLASQLASDDTGFFIHVDKKVDAAIFNECNRVPGVSFLPHERRLSVYWGEFSQVEATLELMRFALAVRPEFDYFVFLQGSDYLLRSRRYIQGFFAANRGQEFMSLVKLPAPGFPLAKINKIRYPSTEPVKRFLSRALSRAGMFHRDYRKVLGFDDAYAGDACWALSRAACSFILEQVSVKPALCRYFRNAFTSDEMFFHTIIANSPFRGKVRRNLMYRYWPGAQDHPAVLTHEHVSGFERVARVCVSDQFGTQEVLFARKFTDERMDLIDRIDRMIERKGDS